MSALPERLVASLADRYRIERELGAGGMATVYLAHDLKHDRDVAIKVLHPELAAALGGERFLAEIKTTAKLQHPHILPLLDSGETGAEGRDAVDGKPETSGLLYYVMPLVTGETLRARLERERQLPIPDAVRIAREVASALDYAHRHGVIHRDIKPENILLHDGSAIVADFGIALAVQTAGGARMTQTGLSLGTPQYMSPEQAMGERTIDARSDIYALGAVTYEMLTGEPPFTGATLQAVVAKVISAEPERPSLIRKSVPAHVEQAVLTALEKLPADRHATSAEFALALTSSALSTGASATATTTRSARRVSTVAGALLLLASGLLAGWFARPMQRATQSFADVQPVRLTHAGAVGCAAIAPGGEQFAAIIGSFNDETSCSGSLVVRPLPTGADQLLAADVRGVWKIIWSPAGDAVLLAGTPFEKAEGVWIYPTKGGVARQIAMGGTLAVGFLDARHVFVVPGNGATFFNNNGVAPSEVVRVLDVESGVVTDSVVLPSATYQGEGAFSPSGKWFVLTKGVPAPVLYLVSRSGQRTDSLPGVISNVAWMGDARVAYYRDRSWGPGDVLVHSVDPETGRFTGDPALIWSALPTARSFTSDSAGRRLMAVLRPVTDELHLMRLPNPTTSRALVRSLNAYLGDPKFSPDGRRVAYSRQDALGYNVYSIDRDDGVERAISSDTLNTFWFTWLDAQHLVRSDLKGALLSVDLATGRVRRLTAPPGEAIVTAAGNSWMFLSERASPPVFRDSLLGNARSLGNPPGIEQSLSYALSATGSHVSHFGVLSDGRMGFSVFNMTTAAWSAPTPLDSGLKRLATVASDGTVYLSRLNGNTEIWRSRNGTSPTLYARLPLHCYEGSVVVSDDGSTVACNVTTSLPDAWLVDVPESRR